MMHNERTTVTARYLVKGLRAVMSHLLSSFLIFLSIVKLVRLDRLVHKASLLQRGPVLNMGSFKRHSHHFLESFSSQHVSLKVVKYSYCVIECINTPFCRSFNVASQPDDNGSYICELLKTDKYISPSSFRANQDFHHYSIPSPCDSNPCLNGGACHTIYHEYKYNCVCNPGYQGTYCEQANKGLSLENLANTCAEVLDDTPNSPSGGYFLRMDDGEIQQTYCHMGEIPGCGGGAWTLVMKINGSKMTFHHDSQYWSDKLSFNVNAGVTGFDWEETKLPSYWNTPFTKLCLGMRIGVSTRWIAVNYRALSLHSLLADGVYSSTSLGRDTWKSLINDSSLQLNCNKEGFNVRSSGLLIGIKNAARVGILGNDLFGCLDCDSRLGFGTKGNLLSQDNGNSCGNEAAWAFPDNGIRHTTAHCYILVQ